MSKWKDGLPPVGEVVESRLFAVADWHKCDVVAHHEGDCVVASNICGYEGSNDPNDFRPLKSEADRKRDKAVGALALQVIYCYEPEIEPLDATPYKRMAEKLHDAGYRKIKPLTDEQIETVMYATCTDFGNCRNETAAYQAGMRFARKLILGEEP